MARGRFLKISDVKALLQLSNGLHSAPDPVSRKRQMLMGLCRLTGARCGAVIVTSSDETRGKRSFVSRVIFDPANDEVPCVPDPADKSGVDPLVEWANIDVVPSGTHLACSRQLGDMHGTATIYLFRPAGRRSRFTARHRLMVDLFHRNTCWVYEPDLVLLSPGARTLSPRERQTLEHLLVGLGEKQIATQLRLSRNTVHHYVKSLHRHFRVSSRSELLARWVGK